MTEPQITPDTNEYDWVVLSFSHDTLFGTVARGSGLLRFHSTSFQSDTSLRFPRVGEEVSVVTNRLGVLLAVHGR